MRKLFQEVDDMWLKAQVMESDITWVCKSTSEQLLSSSVTLVVWQAASNTAPKASTSCKCPGYFPLLLFEDWYASLIENTVHVMVYHLWVRLWKTLLSVFFSLFGLLTWRKATAHHGGKRDRWSEISLFQSPSFNSSWAFRWLQSWVNFMTNS